MVREMMTTETCVPPHLTFRKDKPDLTDSVIRVGKKASAAFPATVTSVQGRGATAKVKKVQQSMDTTGKQSSVGRQSQSFKHAGRRKLDSQIGGGGSGSGNSGADHGTGGGGGGGGGGIAGGGNVNGGSSRIGKRSGAARKVKLPRARVDGVKQREMHITNDTVHITKVQKKAQEREKKLAQKRKRYRICC